MTPDPHLAVQPLHDGIDLPGLGTEVVGLPAAGEELVEEAEEAGPRRFRRARLVEARHLPGLDARAAEADARRLAADGEQGARPRLGRALLLDGTRVDWRILEARLVFSREDRVRRERRGERRHARGGCRPEDQPAQPYPGRLANVSQVELRRDRARR